ncbi:MAG: hypothetical protein CTY36_00885 [Methylocystis sp.]|nr:MAG: hypothetical protein CTY36_00885 [Methylocystis sp.]PWB90114.1 hypothetical protein C5688_12500 [Methylocystis sp. MitZ-2018]
MNRASSISHARWACSVASWSACPLMHIFMHGHHEGHRGSSASSGGADPSTGGEHHVPRQH